MIRKIDIIDRYLILISNGDPYMWIALLITAIAYLSYWIYQQIKPKPLKPPVKVIIGLDIPPPALFFWQDTTEDTVIDFGHKAIWLRVKSTDSIAVQSEIDIILAQITNVSPPQPQTREQWILTTVEDWVLVSSYDIPFPDDIQKVMQLKQLVQELSRIFGEVHYFGNHRTVQYYAWAKAVSGTLIRAYAYIDQAEDPLWEEGKLTLEEIQLELDFRDLGRMVEWEEAREEDNDHVPDEQSVKMIAAAWRATSDRPSI